MKKIAVITMGVKLNNEKGYTRFKFLSEFLVDAGYEVDLITTTFQHWEKAQRNISEIQKTKKYGPADEGHPYYSHGGAGCVRGRQRHAA